MDRCVQSGKDKNFSVTLVRHFLSRITRIVFITTTIIDHSSVKLNINIRYLFVLCLSVLLGN